MGTALCGWLCQLLSVFDLHIVQLVQCFHLVQNYIPSRIWGMIKGPFSLSHLPQGITCGSGPQAWPPHLTIIYSHHAHSAVNSVLLCSYPHELDVSVSV